MQYSLRKGIFVVLVVMPLNVFSQVLSINEYIAQVKSNNIELKAANLSIDSLDKKSFEMDMVYSPVLTGNYTTVDDKSGPSISSTLIASEIKSDVWNLCLSKKTKTGSTLSLGYTNSFGAISLLIPYDLAGLSLNDFTANDIKPFVKLEQSLVRDFKSRLTEAGINKAKAAYNAGRYAQILKIQQVLLKARSNYLSLALAREIVNFRQEELARADEILKWNENRINLNLADNGDLLQAQALQNARDLSLQLAREDEKNICRDFNEIRGDSNETVPETINGLSDLISICADADNLIASGQRVDVLSVKATYESKQYAELETKYRSSPEISVFGVVSLHDLSVSQDNMPAQMVIADDKPAYTLGVNLMMPLDFHRLDKIRQGYALDSESLKEEVEKTNISSRKDWAKLTETWSNVKIRLKKAQKIRTIQTERAENERSRFRRGRTTMIQLMSAENDLDDATINVYRLIIEELMTYFQSELYNTKEYTEK